jgi:Sec-independent protein translocase protein TatA
MPHLLKGLLSPTHILVIVFVVVLVIFHEIRARDQDSN